jgi:hypothetical protein
MKTVKERKVVEIKSKLLSKMGTVKNVFEKGKTSFKLGEVVEIIPDPIVMSINGDSAELYTVISIETSWRTKSEVIGDEKNTDTKKPRQKKSKVATKASGRKPKKASKKSA